MKSPKLIFGLAVIFLFICGCASSGSIRDALKSAVEGGNLDEVKAQMALYGSAGNMRDDNGKTLLHLATEYGHADMVEYLLTKGINPDSTDRIGDTPLQIAAYKGYPGITEQLINAGANVNTDNNYGITPLLNALFNQQYDIARLLIDNGANVNAKSVNGSPPLHVAAKNGNLEFVKFLLDRGANVHTGGQFNFKAIHFASEHGHLDVVKYLVSRGADVNARDTYGRTPLHEAIQKGHLEIVRFLVQNGADYRIRDLQGTTPLKLARRSKNREIEYLITGLFVDQGNKKTAQTDPSSDYSTSGRFKPPKSTLPAAAQKIDFGQYNALVIGNNDYRYLPKLQTAISDAGDVSRILRNDYGFRVQLLLDADRSQILLALNRLRTRLGPRDNLLIYYAGHGWLDKEGDEGYWLPVDAQLENTVNWVSNSSITTMLRGMRAKHVLIVADSCYAGKLARGVHKVKKSPDYLYRISNKRARSVLSSGGLEPVVDSGGAGHHSVFASAFITALLDNDGIMDGTQLFSNIRRPVMLNSDQTPEYSDLRKAGHDGGDFIFVRRPQ